MDCGAQPRCVQSRQGSRRLALVVRKLGSCPIAAGKVDWPFRRRVALETHHLLGRGSSHEEGDDPMVTSHAMPALRALLRRPGLTLARVATTALVVAAVSSVTAIASATLLSRLPFPDPDRLVQIYDLSPDATDIGSAMFLFPVTYGHIDARGPSVEKVAGIWSQERAITGRGEPESVTAGRVSPDFFAILGAPFARGRGFTPEEAKTDAPVVVLSHGLWTRGFGADPAILGSAIQIDRRPHTVIGVTGARFEPAFTQTELWTPLALGSTSALRATVVQTIGRLRVGATPASATADLQPVLASARQELPDLLEMSTINAMDLHEFRHGPRRNALLMLAAAVLALSLIAIANLANLTFADLASRLGDVALRSALGASTRAIVVAELVPCALIAVGGSAVGLWLAATAAPWILTLDESLGRTGISIVVDGRVALAGLAGAGAVMFAAVAIPAWRVARRDQAAFLVAGRLTDARGGRIRAWLVGVQTAMALAVLSTGAVVVVSLHRTSEVDAGFDATNVVAGQLRFPESAFADHAARARFVRAVLDRLRDTPGIVGAGTTLNLFVPGSSYTTNVTVEDAPRPDGQAHAMQFRRVSPGYFDAMRIPLIRGRDFGPSDTEASPIVAIVSESFAQRFWPNGSALGRRVKRGAASAPWAEIVGVVPDVRDAGLRDVTGAVLYTSYYQGSSAATSAGLVVRTAADPRTALAQIKQAVWSVDAAQPLANVVFLEAYLAKSLGPQRFRAWLVGLCSVFGLLLATVGIYAVTSRSVSERTREVGIRIALGGIPAQVRLGLVVRSLDAMLCGVAAGGALSVMADAGLVRLLPDLGGGGWAFNLGAAVLMACTGAAAAMAAARRAVDIEPARALRGD
jgi:predicted permease